MALKKDQTTIKDVVKDRMEETGLSRKIEPKEAKLLSIRFPENYVTILKNHFKEQGLGISTGIRTILIRYMKENGLI